MFVCRQKHRQNQIPFPCLCHKLGCLRQQLLGSPLERGAGGVLRQTYTPLYPLFLEGNYKRLKSYTLNSLCPSCLVVHNVVMLIDIDCFAKYAARYVASVRIERYIVSLCTT